MHRGTTGGCLRFLGHIGGFTQTAEERGIYDLKAAAREWALETGMQELRRKTRSQRVG